MQTRPRPKRYRKTNRRAKPVRVGKPKLTLEPHQIVLRPIVTEKGTHQSERYNSFCFEVHSAANKTQIRSAIESLFPVRVTTVRTQVRMGKEKRFRGAAGRQPDWKKAVVTLHPDDKIEFF